MAGGLGLTQSARPLERLATIGWSRAFLAWRKRRDPAADLELHREAIVERVDGYRGGAGTDVATDSGRRRRVVGSVCPKPPNSAKIVARGGAARPLSGQNALAAVICICSHRKKPKP